VKALHVSCSKLDFDLRRKISNVCIKKTITIDMGLKEGAAVPLSRELGPRLVK